MNVQAAGLDLARCSASGRLLRHCVADIHFPAMVPVPPSVPESTLTTFLPVAEHPVWQRSCAFDDCRLIRVMAGPSKS